MANKITGKITFISQTYQVSTQRGAFNKRELWIAPMYFDRYTGEPTPVSDEYSVSVEFANEKCSLLDTFKVGDVAVVTFDLRGRVTEKDGRKSCFSSIDGRGIERFGQKSAQGDANVVSETESQQPVAQQQESPLPF